ncbi:hypothetical protein CcCBS67573_g03294 [Chytriomyces confervae]|uniref:Tyrosinase copper-binding domain-containing protein n=1 Tax=Chytriomyces confervae TaxID=246404 RepID=A0A507FGD0_9FUNG|nr:hypothetical protein HDU80_008036 [Chytriomyces hyalinus]TPX75431.1 hypothetical protein CcCBS67573_g03294 [Chytriomyces confervae]
MKLAAFLLLRLLLVTSALAACTTWRTRKEWRDLSLTEKRNFINAVNRIRANGDYAKYVGIHYRNIDAIHSTPLFLPWHREMLRRFEDSLRKVDPSVTLPYWDWSNEGGNPIKLNPALFSSSDTSVGTKSSGCMRDGFVSGYTHTNSKGCLRRDYDDHVRFPDYTTVAVYVLNAPNYDAFIGGLEPDHNSVHNNIGGDGGDMTDASVSPEDPIFYFHHTNVDRLYDAWQRRGKSRITSYNGGNINSQLPGLSPVTISQSMKGIGTSGWCIRYQAYSNVKKNVPKRRDSFQSDARALLQRYNHTTSLRRRDASDNDGFVVAPGKSRCGSGRYKTHPRQPFIPLSDRWLTITSKQLNITKNALEKRVRASERARQRRAKQYDDELDVYLEKNPQATYHEGFQHVVNNWKWRGYDD